VEEKRERNENLGLAGHFEQVLVADHPEQVDDHECYDRRKNLAHVCHDLPFLQGKVFAE